MAPMVGFFIFDDIVEIVIVVIVVVVVVVLVLKAIFNSASSSVTKSTTSTAGATHGYWTIQPSVIPASPSTGAFTYHVDFTPTGGTVAPLPGRSINFTMSGVASGSGQIASITDQAGLRSINSTTVTGVTDPNGDIVLDVQLESNQSAQLIASDMKSGNTDPPLSFQAQ